MVLSPKGRPQRIRDPLHNLIEFDVSPFQRMLWEVVQSPPYQRLRRIRQLGFSEYVYPGATHTRFAHSIGVFNYARQLMDLVEIHLGKSRFDPRKAEAALAAALLHDVGHGPFSHAFERIGKTRDLKFAKHENTSDEIIRNTEISKILDNYDKGFQNKVADIIVSEKPIDIYSSVVSSQFDADRLDYMQRDRMMTGTHHSKIDLNWLFANLEIATVPYGSEEKKRGEIETFVLNFKARYAAETYVVGRFQLYLTVYYHKATRSAECVFSHLLERILQLVEEGRLKEVGLSAKNPITRFAKKPKSIDNFIDLDDSVILGALPELSRAKDETVSLLAKMLKNRELPKALDIHQLARGYVMKCSPKIIENPEEFEEIVENAVTLATDAIKEWVSEQGQNNDTPLVWLDSDKRSPYKEIQKDDGPLNQIFIRDPDGELVDLKDVSAIVGAVAPFKLDRAYIPSKGGEIEASIVRIIEQKCKEARKK